MNCLGLGLRLEVWSLTPWFLHCHSLGSW